MYSWFKIIEFAAFSLVLAMLAVASNGVRFGAVGTDGMASLPDIAVRVNNVILKQCGVGSAIRIAGRLARDGEHIWLTSSDGGSVQIRGLADGAVEGGVGSFVEVVGLKSGDASVNAVGVVNLGQECDDALWEEAIRVVNLPLVNELF